MSEEAGRRRQGTINQKTFEAKKQSAEEFLPYVKSVHGHVAVGRMTLADLTTVLGALRRLAGGERLESTGNGLQD